MLTLAAQAVLVILSFMTISFMTGVVCGWYDDSPLLVQVLALILPPLLLWAVLGTPVISAYMVVSHVAGFCAVFLGRRI